MYHNSEEGLNSRGDGLVMITGGIGSGKSVVSRILRLNGYPVYDCDSEAKRIMESELRVIEALIDILGEEAYSESNDAGKLKRLNRAYVASKIFYDQELRGMVNSVVHQAVRDDVKRFALSHRGLTFCETAIPSTSRMEGMCDEIWVVTASEEERIKRVKLRNGFSEEEIRGRIASQKEEFDGLDERKSVKIENGDDSMLLPRIWELLHITSLSSQENILTII